MKRKTTRAGLLLALAATLLAAWFAPAPASDADVVPTRQAMAAGGADRQASSVAPLPSAVRSAAALHEPAVLRIHSRDADAQDGDNAGLFASLHGSEPGRGIAPEVPVPVVQSATPPAPEPQAPPLPFRVLGRYVEDGETVVFLAHNDRNLAVRVGDTIAEHYRVEGMQRGVLNLVYLPLNQTQTLEVGGGESEE